MMATKALSPDAIVSREESAEPVTQKVAPVRQQPAPTLLERVKKIFSAGPVMPGESYGAPGRGRSGAISVVTASALLLLWFVATSAGWIAPMFLPSPVAVVERFWEILTGDFANASLLEHTGWSMLRVFGAFALAAVTAIPIGLVIIWLGIGELSKVVLIYMSIFAPMALSARAGVRSVAIEQIHAAYSMGASRWQVIRFIILKSALPEILTGMRIGIGFGWTTLVAAEMVAAQAGLGFMVLNAAEFLATDVVIMGIVVIGIIAYLFDMLMRYAERKLVPWKGK